jgi:hypothetical protein
VRSADELEAVQHLIAAGLNDCAIARQTGIPRRTVRTCAADQQFEQGLRPRHQVAESIMTFPRSHQPPTAICSGSIWAMAAFHGAAACGG